MILFSFRQALPISFQKKFPSLILCDHYLVNACNLALHIETIFTMDFRNDIEHCVDVLRKGGLILYPTDTIWGIGCDATNDEAVHKIFALKKRAETKSMI